MSGATESWNGVDKCRELPTADSWLPASAARPGRLYSLLGRMIDEALAVYPRAVDRVWFQAHQIGVQHMRPYKITGISICSGDHDRLTQGPLVDNCL